MKLLGSKCMAKDICFKFAFYSHFEVVGAEQMGGRY